MPSAPAAFEHQNWDTIVFRKHAPKGKEATGDQALKAFHNGANVVTSKKFDAGKNSKGTPSNAAKLDRDTETLKHATVSHDFKVSLQKARQAKNMTQKALASAINEKPSVINEYESGKAVPNGQLISKMERALGCKLPRTKAPKTQPADE
jgi:putative transcription factor